MIDRLYFSLRGDDEYGWSLSVYVYLKDGTVTLSSKYKPMQFDHFEEAVAAMAELSYGQKTA